MHNEGAVRTPLGIRSQEGDCGLQSNNYSLKGKNYQDDWQVGTVPYSDCLESWRAFAKDSCWELIPAWSLHQLLSMLPDNAPKIYWILDGASISIEIEDEGTDFFPHKGDIYEGVVKCIEWLIKEGYFNKDYLEE